MLPVFSYSIQKSKVWLLQAMWLSNSKMEKNGSSSRICYLSTKWNVRQPTRCNSFLQKNLRKVATYMHMYLYILEVIIQDIQFKFFLQFNYLHRLFSTQCIWRWMYCHKMTLTSIQQEKLLIFLLDEDYSCQWHHVKNN